MPKKKMSLRSKGGGGRGFSAPKAYTSFGLRSSKGRKKK